jgi:hypothetical protein
MADFPYTTVAGKLKPFFDKIQQVGKPETVDKKWLASLGFGASNDPSIMPVLKFIGFIDQAGKPTPRWIEFRDRRRAAQVLAAGIQEGYSELFAMYPDANQRSDEDLKNFFRTRSEAGDQAISKTVSTFKSLCEMADFGQTAITSNAPNVSEAVAPPKISTSGGITDTVYSDTKRIPKALDTGITININIQLTMPETTDESVYIKFFAALKNQLLSG